MDGRDIARENKLTYKVGKEELYANHGNVNLRVLYYRQSLFKATRQLNSFLRNTV